MPSEKNMHSIQENRWRCLWENFVSMARYYCIVLSFEVPCSSRKKKRKTLCSTVLKNFPNGTSYFVRLCSISNIYCTLNSGRHWLMRFPSRYDLNQEYVKKWTKGARARSRLHRCLPKVGLLAFKLRHGKKI